MFCPGCGTKGACDCWMVKYRTGDAMAEGQGAQETALIILPLPPSILSPNRVTASFGGRMKKASASKRYRRLAKKAAQDQGIQHPWERAVVQATFYHKQKRRRDDVNHLGMLKPAYDGVVDGGLLKDDDSRHLTTLPAVFKLDREHSRVELLFTRCDGRENEDLHVS